MEALVFKSNSRVGFYPLTATVRSGPAPESERVVFRSRTDPPSTILAIWNQGSGNFNLNLQYWEGVDTNEAQAELRVGVDPINGVYRHSAQTTINGRYGTDLFEERRRIWTAFQGIDVHDGDTILLSVTGSRAGLYDCLLYEPVSVNADPSPTDDYVTVTQSQSVTIAVLDNDSDPENDPLTLTSVGNPANGTAVISDDRLIYTPSAGYVGDDSFTYTVNDGHGGSSEATVYVTIEAMPNEPPIATDDYVTVLEGNTILIPVLDNDSDPDNNPLTLEVVNTPQNGTAEIMGNGAISYTPKPRYIGSDSFTYGITDGSGGGSMATIHVSVAEDVNLPPAEEIDHLLKEKLYPFEATFVMDGDTVRGNAHLGLGVSISVIIRLLGLNAPDLNEITGQLARAKVQEILFEQATAVRVQTDSTGKYGRWLGIIWYQDETTGETDWLSLNQRLLDEGLAVEYDGQTAAP